MSRQVARGRSFLEVVGSRRSIRWFDPRRAVERRTIQRILEAARLTSSPGNVQPWRAVVVERAELDAPSRERLLAANNRQGPHVLAPVWIYWYADPSAVTPSAFLTGIRSLLAAGSLPPAFGWSEEAAEAAVEHGTPAPVGMPGLDRTVHRLPPPVSAAVAAQETNAACTVATLAAVGEGLGTCLQPIAAPDQHEAVRRILGVPGRFVPVWLQLVGHPAEDPKAGGQRPRAPFEEMFSWGRYGMPFKRDPEIVEGLRREGLIQAPAPLRGRAAELDRLAREFAPLLHAVEVRR